MKTARPYAVSSTKILEDLDSKESGLSPVEATRRLQLYGPNQLPEGKSESLFLIFLRQFKNPLIYILLAVSVITVILGEYTDSLVIFAVLLFNSIIGTFQEGKAQKILISLKNFVTTDAPFFVMARKLLFQTHKSQ